MNHQNKTSKNFFSSPKIIRASSFVFIAAALVVSGFFAPQQAFAAAIVTPADNSTNISIDTTSGGGTGIFSDLEGPAITENIAGDIAEGTHTITLPSGWEFDTSSNITISKFGKIVLGSTSVTPTQTSFSFVVSSQSTSASVLGFSGLKVRPTGTIPSTGNMTYSGIGIVGVISGGTNFGTLSSVPGTVTQLAFTTQPGDAEYGSLLNPQPIVKTQDQFGNDSVKDLASSLEVELTLTSGTGALVGDAALDIGTGAGNGTVTFTDLTVDEFGTDKQLTAAATGLTSAISDNFEITKKALSATVTVNDKTYDGNADATITDVELDGVEEGDDVEADFSAATATFEDENAGTGKTVTATGITLFGDGDDKDNYTYDGTATGTANITPLEVVITPTVGQTRVYGNDDPEFTYTFLPTLIGGDEFTGTLSREAGEDVGTYVYTLGDLSAGPNYNLILDPEADIFLITQRPLTVTATGVNREYDGTTDATVTLSSDDEILGDNLEYNYENASFFTKTAENGKTVDVSGISIGGAKASNYDLQNTEAVTTANITKKPITVTINVNNKTYNGTTGATYSSTNPRVAVGVIEGDDVDVEDTGSKAFVDKHVGVGKTVNATGLTLSGGDEENYDFDGNGTGIATINPRPITVTAVTDSKVYDGTTSSNAIPEITSPNSPPVVSGDTANFIQVYDNRNVGTGRTLTPSGAVDDGNSGNNYTVTFVPADVGTITEKDINITAQPDTKVYDGTTLSDVAPVVDDLEIGDTVGTAPTQEYETKDVGTGKTLTPSGLVINDGNDGKNYKVNYVNDETGVIEAKELTVSGATTDSKTYDGGVNATINFASVALNGVVPGEEALISLDSTGYSAEFDNKNVGTGKTVTVSGLDLSGAGESNYSLIQPVLDDGVITARTLTISAVTDIKTYDGTTDSDALPEITDGGLQFGDTADFTQSYDTKDVGEDKTLTPKGVVNDGNEGNNYSYIFVEDETGVITKASLTITADNKSKVYGDANPTLTASYVGFVAGEDESVLDTPVELSTTADVASPVGDYLITALGALDNNYDITHENGTLTVNQAPIEITPDEDQGKIYGDSDEEITYTASGFKNDEDESLFTGALGRESGENAGEYLITQGTLDVGGNYFVDSFFDVFYTIEPRPLTITAVTDTKTYDGGITSGVTPLITDGELQFDDTPGFTQTYDNENVGEGKTLTPNGVVNDGNEGDNYSYDYVSVDTGEITQLEITVTPDAGQSKVYGEDDPVSFTYTNAPALIGEDVFSGGLSRAEGENVGTYEYELGSLTADGNYSLVLETETFEIVKATPVITWGNPSDIVYGAALSGTELNATADVDGEFVYTPVSGTVLDAGVEQTLSTTFTPDDTDNYNSVTQEVLITVAPAPLTVTADDKSKEYGASDPALTYEFSGLVNDDTDAVFSGALERDPDEVVGIYAINQGTLSAGNNYVIIYESGTFTIEDTVAPTIVSHTPSVNAVNVAVGNSITITFSEPVIVGEGDIILNPATGFTINGSGTNVITLTPTLAWNNNTLYTVTVTTNVADVNEVNLEDEYSWNFITATSYSISLNADAGGWNLISLPVVPINKNISVVLSGVESSIDAVWTYDPLNPNAVNGWLVYVPGNPEETSNLDIMTAGYGYWINTTGNATISSSGSLLPVGPTTPPSRNLVAGWNLIGYYQVPGEESSQPDAAFASLGGTAGLSGLWGFNNSTGAFTSVTTILPGDAFWISLPSAKVYTPSNL